MTQAKSELLRASENMVGPPRTAESGWVIEHRTSPTYAPAYWAGNGWSVDNLCAIRFARKVDAERTIAGFDEDDPLPNEQPHRIAEHGWG
jgi:hypothetical protein